MFKSYLLLALTIVAGLSATACSASANEALNTDNVANAYAQLIDAEQQLLQSELAVEARKSASYTKLLASGSASWLENRQQKLVVDILSAKLTAYQEFASQAKATLTGGEIEFESAGKESAEMRQTAMQGLQTELTSLRQADSRNWPMPLRLFQPAILGRKVIDCGTPWPVIKPTSWRLKLCCCSD